MNMIKEDIVQKPLQIYVYFKFPLFLIACLLVQVHLSVAQSSPPVITGLQFLPSTTEFCTDDTSGKSVRVTFTGSFNNGDRLIIEISDKNGNFTSPKLFRSNPLTNGTTSSFIVGINSLADGLPKGNGYKIRVRSTNTLVKVYNHLVSYTVRESVDVTLKVSNSPTSGFKAKYKNQSVILEDDIPIGSPRYIKADISTGSPTNYVFTWTTRNGTIDGDANKQTVKVTKKGIYEVLVAPKSGVASSFCDYRGQFKIVPIKVDLAENHISHCELKLNGTLDPDLAGTGYAITSWRIEDSKGNQVGTGNTLPIGVTIAPPKTAVNYTLLVRLNATSRVYTKRISVSPSPFTKPSISPSVRVLCGDAIFTVTGADKVDWKDGRGSVTNMTYTLANSEIPKVETIQADSKGCKTDLKLEAFKSVMNITPSVGTKYCDNQSLAVVIDNITRVPAFTWQSWTTTNGSIGSLVTAAGGASGPKTNITGMGNYTISIRENASRCTMSKSINIGITDNPIKVTPEINYCGSNANFEVQPATLTNIVWKNSTGVEVSRRKNFTTTTMGNYTVEAKDVANCLHTKQVSFRDITSFKIKNNKTGKEYSSAFRTQICEGETVSLSVVNNAKATYNYLWKVGNKTVANGSSVDLKESGMYTVKGTIGNSTSCSTDFKFIIEKENINISTSFVGAVSGDMLCGNKTITVTASGANLYDWYDGKGFVSDATYSVTKAGVYSFKAKSTKGCTYLKSFEIKDALIPQLSATNTYVCEGVDAEIQARGGSIYKWNIGSNNSTIKVSKSGIYTVEITKNGCTLSDSIKIEDKNINFGVRNNLFYVDRGETVRLDAYGGDSYLWNDEVGSSSVITEPIIKDSKYVVSIENNDGCKKKYWVYIKLKDKLDNIITPDGDGENDIWALPDKYRHKDIKIIIYNRLGMKVYEKNDYDNSWSGEGLLAGTYFYVIKLKDSFLLKGSLNVIK